MTDSQYLPEDRVAAYLDKIDLVNALSPNLQYADEVHVIDDLPLSRSDLRDVLKELAMWRDATGRALAAAAEREGRVTELEDRRIAVKQFLSDFAHNEFVQKAIEMMEDEP